MKMNDVEVSLDDGQVLITQEDHAGTTWTVALCPEQVPLVCEWLMRAIDSASEKVRFEN